MDARASVGRVLGTLLGGRYRVDELIGRGRLGDVWRCTDESLGRTVAVKVVSVPPEDRERLAEWVDAAWTRVMQKFDHHGVVHVYESRLDEQVGPFVIMEYVEGESLASILAREGTLNPAQTMDIVAKTADGLQYMWNWGVVHRCLRPAKILVRSDATIALSAAGLEYALGPASVMGALFDHHPHYVTPEAAMGHQLSTESDIFALGVIAHQCLTGRPPFNGDRPLEIAMRVVRDPTPPLPPDVPVDVASIVERSQRSPRIVGAPPTRSPPPPERRCTDFDDGRPALGWEISGRRRPPALDAPLDHRRRGRRERKASA